jgi:hypothetical protein
MGTFTVTLQEAIDLSPRDITPYVALGLDTYPIFDETYREALNDKIIAHFNEQEIGHETISMFQYAMRRKMSEIMPLYNQHYIASRIAIDPLLTVNIHNVVAGTLTDTTTTTGTETNTTNSTSDSQGRVVGSNTPQVRLAGNADYATSAQDSTGHTAAEGTASQNTDNTRNGSQDTNNDGHTTGYSGNPAEIIFSLRQTFVNVDMMVINELEELFMMVWDNGEEFTRPGMGQSMFFNGFYGWF